MLHGIDLFRAKFLVIERLKNVIFVIRKNL